jgi:hypothetical protein
MDTAIGKDNDEIANTILRTNFLFFWHRAKFSLTNKKLTGQIPNTILRFIPAGKYEIVHPVKSISSIGYYTKPHPVRFIIGLSCLFIAVIIHSLESFIIYGTAALIILDGSYTTKFEVFTNTARPQGFEVSFFDRKKMKDFVTKINNLITK